LVVLSADSIFIFESNPLSRLSASPRFHPTMVYSVNHAASQQQRVVALRLVRGGGLSELRFINQRAFDEESSYTVIPTFHCGAGYGNPWIVRRSLPL
jgi:hypothetical protein